MLKKIFSGIILSLTAMSGLFSAQLEYDIQDIGTLQTKASEAIAINSKGQILGWYNIDGSNDGKRYFVRDRDGCFHEIAENSSIVYENVPQQYYTIRIEWRYLTDAGNAYGTLTLPNGSNPILFMWEKHNGLVKLGVLPGKEVMAINNSGQVLIKSIGETENGKSIRRPVIWQNGQVTKLRGLEGNIGIESEESYGLDINNQGDVAGYSVAYLNYKNEIYKQEHAVKWINGEITDLHSKVPKSTSTRATAINDLGDVIVGDTLIREDGKTISGYYSGAKTSNRNYFLRSSDYLLDRDGNKTNPRAFVNARVYSDYDSIWMQCDNVSDVNDNREIIAQCSTIYKEQHAMLLCPKNAD